MLTSTPPPGRKRWPRGQKFALTPAGEDAAAGYRQAVSLSRTSGRSALETALSAWASPLGLKGGDGVVLSELRAGKLGLSDLCDRLESADITPDEVRAALQRLVEAGVVLTIPPASQLGAA
jgi:hypothetical protein